MTPKSATHITLLSLVLLCTSFFAPLQHAQTSVGISQPSAFPFVADDPSKPITVKLASEFAFESSVIDQLRSAGIHVRNADTRNARPTPALAGQQLTLVTRGFGQSHADVTVSVIAWPDEAQASSYVTKQIALLQNKSLIQLIKTFTVQVSGAANAIPTQQTVMRAMQSYAPRDFSQKADRDTDYWESVNTRSRNQGSDLLSYLRNPQYSQHRKQALAALAAYPRTRGAVIANLNEECTASLKKYEQSKDRYVLRGQTFPANAFLESDYLELAPLGKSLEETPIERRIVFDLALTKNDKSCFVHERWDDYGSGLKGCECKALPTTQ